MDVHDIVCECWWMYTILCASVGGCKRYCLRVLVVVNDIVCECWWMYTILCASVGGCTRYCVRVLADVQYICGSTAVIQSDGKLTS